MSSRRAATGVRSDRGARPKTVEEHDRRFCQPTAADLAFLTRVHGPQQHAVPWEKTRWIPQVQGSEQRELIAFGDSRILAHEDVLRSGTGDPILTIDAPVVRSTPRNLTPPRNPKVSRTVEGGVVWGREVACGEVSGKSLATLTPGRCDE